MYFTNINNDELQYFKNQLIPFNFSMSLTSILSSSLFNIEDMGNNIYRIYPLFYCNSITCSDNDTRILDTRCIIAVQKNNETYFKFLYDENEETVYTFDNESYYPAHSIEDKLSVDDFNRLVYILRRNTKHYDKLEIKHDTLITSTYGEYTFDLKDSTVSDEGIIITPRTLANQCTVTLTNPVFVNSKYYLHLKISKINNINLCEDDNNPILEDEIIVPLIRNVPVDIPFDGVELYNIIGFDATVEIIHSEPILVQESHIELTSNVNHVDIGESVTLNAVYYDELSVKGKTIVFKANGTVIGSSVTNNNGLATLTYTPANIGDLNIFAEYENSITSNSVNVTVTKLTPSLILESNKTSIIGGEIVLMSGTLSYQNIGIRNATIKLYNNNVLIDTLTTDNEGIFDKTLILNDDASLTAVFEGDNTYKNVNSNNVNITVLFNDIDLTSDKSILSYADNEYATLTAQLMKNNTLVKLRGRTVTFTAYKQSDDTLINIDYNIYRDSNINCDIGHFFLAGKYTTDEYGTNRDITNVGDYILLKIGSFTGNPSITQYHSPQGSIDVSAKIFDFNTVGINAGDVIKIVHEENEYKFYINNVYHTSVDDIDSYYDEGISLKVPTDGTLVLDSYDVIYSRESVSVNTNVNGVASVDYYGKGAGDIYIKAECMNLIQTYEIKDYWAYKINLPEYTQSVLAGDYKKYILNNPIYLPSSFKITFKGKSTANSSIMITAMIGENTNDYYYSGFDGEGLLHCISRNNARAVLTRDSNQKPYNTEYTISITYDGVNMVISDGTHSISNNNSEFSKDEWIGLLVGKSQSFSLFKVEKL